VEATGCKTRDCADCNISKKILGPGTRIRKDPLAWSTYIYMGSSGQGGYGDS
jgi:hypothetical protein